MPGRHPGSPQALLFRDREKKRKPPPGEEEGLEPGEDSLEEERKIPLKLSRRGERGGDSWQKGNTLLGDPGLVRGLVGADTGLEGRCGEPREQKKPLEGLPMLWGLSTFREGCFCALSSCPSSSGMAKVLRSWGREAVAVIPSPQGGGAQGWHCRLQLSEGRPRLHDTPSPRHKSFCPQEDSGGREG